jgi:Flp pilus assembly pilin Flp
MKISERMWLTMATLLGRVEDRKNERGITAIEYAVMAALIVGVIAGAMVVLGDKIESLFNGISTSTPTTTTP